MPVILGRNAIVMASVTLWLIVIGTGMGMIWNYQNQSGDCGNPRLNWPDGSRIPRVPGTPTLVMVAHPRCPCTRSSIGELALVMARCQGRVSAFVLFFRPAEFPDTWDKTDLWYSASEIPGVTVIDDPDGSEATRFNVVTSGATLLYDRAGLLVFSGGITASRGHSGDNDGRSAIISFLANESPDKSHAPVFGCSLVDNDARSTGGATECRK